MIKLRTQNDGHSFRGWNKYIKKDLDEIFAMCTFNSSLDVWQMSRNRTKELNYGYTISISQPEFNSNYCEMFSNNFYGATDYLPNDTEIDYNQVKLPFSIKIEEQSWLTAHFYFLINSGYPFYPPKVFNIDEVRNDFIDERSGLVSLSWLCEEWTPAITLSIIIEQLVYFVWPPKEIRDSIDFTQSKDLKK